MTTSKLFMRVYLLIEYPYISNTVLKNVESGRFHKITSRIAFIGLAVVMVVGGGIFLATATMERGSSVTLIPSAYADANCDKAGSELNVRGNYRGNLKQCIDTPFFETDGEQPRSCYGPNAFKDNDEDFFVYCKTRGYESTP